MEGGKRKEIENKEARDREELFNIGAFFKDSITLAEWESIGLPTLPIDTDSNQEGSSKSGQSIGWNLGLQCPKIRLLLLLLLGWISMMQRPPMRTVMTD